MNSITCQHCETLNKEGARYCKNCGTFLRQPQQNREISYLNQVITFYVATIAFIVVTHFIFQAWPTSFGVDLGVEIAFIALVVGFAVSEFKNIAPLYKAPKINEKVAVLTLVVPLFTALTVSYGLEWLSQLLPTDFQLENYVSGFFYLENPLLWAIVSVAILPPIFEELAFRGYLYEILSKVTSEKMTIVATAALFALVHFSFVSILWIFPFGLFLGYLRKRYNTLWLPMIVHFIHNFIVVMIDYYDYSGIF